MAAHFDLPDIKLFVNIAEANSLTRGAERSHMSLPAASIRIKNLEEGLGVKLLYRTSQGVTLTPPGQAFMHHARLVLQQLADLRGDLGEYVKGTRGHVRIFANTTAMAEFLPALLPKFLASHPDVNVDLKERLSHDIVRAVSEGKVDVGILAGNVRTEGLETLPFREDRLVLVTSPTHPLAERGRIDFSEALSHDFVGMIEASAIHAFLAQNANTLNRSIKIRIQVGNFEGRRAVLVGRAPRAEHEHPLRRDRRRMGGAPAADLRAQPAGAAAVCARTGRAADRRDEGQRLSQRRPRRSLTCRRGAGLHRGNTSACAG